MNSLLLPLDYPRLKRVDDFSELVATPFAAGINALYWPRQLAGDFTEILNLVGGGEGIINITDARLQGLRLSPAGQLAREVLLEDQRLLRAQGFDPVLNCVVGYPRDEEPGPVATDVFSFHADSAPVPADTWLCTYAGAASEGLRNDQAQRRVDLPATRAACLQTFGGEDNEDFREYLKENCYDLHYAPKPEAQPFSFGLGHLWRIAIEHPGSLVPPCLHRAPVTPFSRLLLIS
jgi:hypothetical protein